MASLPSYARRINKEISDKFEIDISKNLNCFLVQYDINEMIFVTFFNDKSTVYIELNYSQQYPFRCPKVKINNMNYQCLLKCNFHSFLKRITNKRCLCCSSLTCSNNWKPIDNTYKLLEEIKTNLTTKLRCIELLHIKKIKDKYLNADIPIEDFI